MADEPASTMFSASIREKVERLLKTAPSVVTRIPYPPPLSVVKGSDTVVLGVFKFRFKCCTAF